MSSEEEEEDVAYADTLQEDAVVVASPMNEEDDEDSAVVVAALAVEETPFPKKSTPSQKKRTNSTLRKKLPMTAASSTLSVVAGPYLVHENSNDGSMLDLGWDEDLQQPTISAVQYRSLESLLTQFCRVPLLAEFSRPVSLLHPEVSFGERVYRLDPHCLTVVFLFCSSWPRTPKL
jgi:hypothetical protein